MMFQGFLDQHPVPGTLDFLGHTPSLSFTSEVDSEASISEASSEDLAPPLEAEVAPERHRVEAVKSKEKKKPRALANMLNMFKGKKKKGSSPSSAQPEPRPGPGSPAPTVEELKAALEGGRLEAAGSLLVLERELAALASAGKLDAEELVRRQSKVEALYTLLHSQVQRVLCRPLEAAPERLHQALAVVAEQEREDQRAAEAGPGAATLVNTRPRHWLQQWRHSVAVVASERMGARPAAHTEGRSEVEDAFLHMGRTMKEDLEAVVERLRPLFPAEFDVVATYARSYHEHFAAHVAALAQFELCERDAYLLLLWAQNLYPNDILKSPKLAAELQAVSLGSLLTPKQIRSLEATFLSSEVANVKGLMARALELEAQRWAQDVAPQKLDGRCHSELAIDIIQIVSQGQAKAENITPDLGKQIKQVLLVELAAFLRSYQHTFDEFLERGKQLTNYRANVIANINNCLSFRTSMEQSWPIVQDPRRHLLEPLSELRSHGFDTLLQSLFLDLKPLFKKFTKTRWAAPAETLEEILTTVGRQLPKFWELQDCFREELMEAVHLHLVKEYITCLSKCPLVLKKEEQQQQLARNILANAEAIRLFCTQNGSPATWLYPALPKLAEIIHLQDLNAIKMEVATYATSYPDFSKGHLSAILAIKGNLTNSDVKSIRNILDIDTGTQEPFRPLFSLIKLG
ncbi:tumor necrosis factor alpha-induced protein 2 [Octodon degus]|uniref:Tumor necrosis factor alpha-induced protein 2 n=1 Tax=Octodon degus TaxID=10160 RepID=A0A6P6DN22_OCTDE|nr:tumor necrosis factor alpha-induced protein 2 [Octodon degus]XP_023561440.1 tumor necrosis factor alpha-induced protein 2 [Octodon degus]XP_023561441.1 tumor necrosis factor alpha-induced protein 2 [Octodon degus]XP_023561442.1 tumor necrosis factor alpha-induced protein 2 [Octodon degus]